MINKKTKIISLILSLGCSLPSLSSAEQYYKWVDSKGVTNYSARPPASNTKKQKISTVSTYADGSRYQKPQRQFQSNSGIPDTQYQYYSNNSNAQQYRTSAPPQRTEEQEAERQRLLKAASTPYKGSQNGQLTAAQLRAQAALNGVNVSSGDSYSNQNNSYSIPKPQQTTPPPSHMTSCDGSGCWDNQGNRYAGNNGTYYQSNGGMCRDIGGMVQCN